MKTRRFYTMLSVALLLLMANAASAAEVAQGKCISFDPTARQIVLEEYGPEISKEQPYGPATGRVSEFDVAKAKIGITPEPGDILRIAYTVADGVRQATKVMNVSKQDLRKK